jgi:hypothetical protein
MTEISKSNWKQFTFFEKMCIIKTSKKGGNYYAALGKIDAGWSYM